MPIMYLMSASATVKPGSVTMDDESISWVQAGSCIPTRMLLNEGGRLSKPDAWYWTTCVVLTALLAAHMLITVLSHTLQLLL